MEAIAKTKYLKGSPRKARLVIDMIRGRNVSQALSILKFTDKRAAGPITKTLESAIANATYLAEQQNIAIDPDTLWVRSCFVDMGPTKNRRRVRPAPQGRAYREQRHYCHITISVTSEQPEKDEKTLKAEAAAAAKKAAGETKKPKAAKKEPAKKQAEPAAEVTPAPENVEAVETEKIPVPEPAAETAAEETKPADAVQEDKNEELERQ